jgi:nucleotide-binding universal stress UspA family protein
VAREVVIALDGSANGEAILPYIPGLVRPNDEMILLHVAPYPPATRRPRLGTTHPIVVGHAVAKLEPDPPMYAEDEEHALDRARSELTDYLRDISLSLRNEGLSVRCEVLFDDDPARAIVEFARGRQPLFIAMATHGRTGLEHALHGSVAEEVIRSGVAPVLVVRPRP